MNSNQHPTVTMISITDKPIACAEEDLLKVERHSKALAEFILKSDTPLTIGLQGEWGSGKTSLMYLLQEKLQTTQVATAWINTWEYSMFRAPRETTPAVLQGLLIKLKDSCGDNWTLNDEAKEKWKTICRFAGALGNQILAGKTGLNAKAAIQDASPSRLANDGLSSIADLKVAITDVICRLIEDPKNDYKRAVFFVDDLDRIHPAEAVEVLEALKNIFDIPHCIFVIAIDYEVVVKGLEGKFGPKTEENEREFRSFFDKIIQLPFSMPTGTYDMENFLASKLRDLGFVMEASRSEVFAKVVKHTVGYNPRSLKRYINSFSLLNSIRKQDIETDDAAAGVDELMLFALLGIQISYPRIFRILITTPDYTEWDSSTAAKLGLDWDIIEKDIQKIAPSEWTDENWEKVVWGCCQRDPYMRARVGSIIAILNLLRDQFGDTVVEQLEQALEIAAITSVDDHAETKQAIMRSGMRIRFEGLEVKADQLKTDGISDESIATWRSLWNPLDQMCKNSPSLQINYAKTACTLNDTTRDRSNRQLLYAVNPPKKSLGFKITIKKASGVAGALHENLTGLNFGIPADLMTNHSNGDLALDARIASVVGIECYKQILEVVFSHFSARLSA